jgi:hypothetical protein
MHSDIAISILEGLPHWQNLLPNAQSTSSLPTMYYEQEEISWYQFLEGFHHINWQTLQQQHYDSIHSPCSGRQWQVGLLKRLWELARELWEDRNKAKHREEVNDRDPETLACNRAIRQLYHRLQNSGADPDNYLWNTSVNDLLTKRRYLKRNGYAMQKDYSNINCTTLLLQQDRWNNDPCRTANGPYNDAATE